MIIFNNTSADFVLISVENDHNFEQNEDRATVILKWTDFSTLFVSGWDLEIEIPSGIKPSLPRSENVEIWL